MSPCVVDEYIHHEKKNGKRHVTSRYGWELARLVQTQKRQDCTGPQSKDNGKVKVKGGRVK